MFNFDNSNSIAFSFWFLLVEWRLFRSACEHHSRVYHWQILTLKKKSAQWNRPCREQKPTRWSLKKRNIFRSTPLRDCWDVFLPFTTLVFFIFFFFFVSRCLSVWPSGDWNAVDVAMRFGLLGQVGTGQLGAMIAIIKPRWTIISRLSDDGSIFFLPTPPPPPRRKMEFIAVRRRIFLFSFYSSDGGLGPSEVVRFWVFYCIFCLNAPIGGHRNAFVWYGIECLWRSIQGRGKSAGKGCNLNRFRSSFDFHDPRRWSGMKFSVNFR